MSQVRSTRTPGAAEWLCLAATPTFAAMALATAVFGDGPMAMLCQAGHGSPLGGMVPMYLLMAAFHSPPWLRLAAGIRGHDTYPDPAELGGPTNERDRYRVPESSAG